MNLVLDDYLDRKISNKSARDIYGVVIEKNQINIRKSRALRKKLIKKVA